MLKIRSTKTVKKTKQKTIAGGSAQAGHVRLRGARRRRPRCRGSRQGAARTERGAELPGVPGVAVAHGAVAGGRRRLPQRLRGAVDAADPQGGGEEEGGGGVIGVDGGNFFL